MLPHIWEIILFFIFKLYIKINTNVWNNYKKLPTSFLLSLSQFLSPKMTNWFNSNLWTRVSMVGNPLLQCPWNPYLGIRKERTDIRFNWYTSQKKKVFGSLVAEYYTVCFVESDIQREMLRFVQRKAVSLTI